MALQNNEDFILGIDLGANSVGWALVACPDANPAGVLRIGARVFEAGMDGDSESGQEESRNRKRREARLHRRQLWRRARRLTKIFNLLQQFGLLPGAIVATPADRQNFLNQLDERILASPWFESKRSAGAIREPLQVLPYLLRAAALDEPLEPHFLGRALYHLAQRRGFLSNRRQEAARKKKDDDEGVVYEGIEQIKDAMKQASTRTLGEYFSRLSPFERRIRSRWTARSMYEGEFKQICEAQTQHHPEILTEDRRKLIYKAIFRQRPLKVQRNLIGHCELEKKRRRAPAYLLISQRFRLLQKVNDLKALPPDEAERPLTPEERAGLIEGLEGEGDLTFSKIRDLLRLRKNDFNLERGGEDKLPGNRTASKFYKAIGFRWLQMSNSKRDRLVEYVHGFQRTDKLREAAKTKWQLDEGAAERLSKIALEGDYFSLSRRAMEKLIPRLEEGVSYAKARKEIYPESFKTSDPVDLLPPVDRAPFEIRNPGVMRSLTELRKVVNAIVRLHGKPAEIRVELARDLRNTKKQRETTWKQNRENQKFRVAVAERIVKAEVGINQPSRNEIRKALLADECGWRCPYTGNTISMDTLLGPEPRFDIEHILPFSRSLDDSFMNLTLCYNEENRRKHNRTPFEAYSGNHEKYEEILQRVKQFQGGAGREKLRRFQMNEEEVAEFVSDFSPRQLNDTRYASRLALDYLGLLYGGRDDKGRVKRVRTTKGQVTAYLRNLWNLNGILNDGPTKNGGYTPKSREDHRHHAVDAVVIALTDDARIQQLSLAAERAPLEHRRRFGSLQGPWPDFVESVRSAVDRVVVSHRVSKKVSGALHEETIYSPPKRERPLDGNAVDPIPHVRKPLAALTKKEMEDIVDPAIRARVQEAADAAGGDPRKAFANEASLPFLLSRKGERIPIRKVRVKKKVPTFVIGEGRSSRHVTPETNHHLEVFAYLDEKGNEVEWDGAVVSLAEAYRRKRLHLPIVNKNHGPETKFKFSLSPGEVLECDNGLGKRKLLVARSVSRFTTGQIQLGLVPIRDARKKAEVVSSGAFLRPGPNTLRQWNARKAAVSVLGEVTEAND